MLDALDRVWKVIDVLRVFLKVWCEGVVECYALWAIIATKTTKRGEWLC